MRKAKIERDILIGGGVLLAGYLIWDKFFSPKSQCEWILNTRMKSPDRENKYAHCMNKEK